MNDEMFQLAFDEAPIAMALVSLDGRILRPNGAFVELTGRTEDELLFLEPAELAHPDDAGLNADQMERVLRGEGDTYRIEKRWLNALGHSLWVVLTASLVRDERQRPLWFIWHVEDGSIRKRDRDRLQRLADHDALTGLLGRRRFHELLGRQLARSRRYNERAFVLMLDLDGFKAINDVYGHAAGDAALRAVAEVLDASVRDSDVTARLGGDEFAVLLLHGDERAVGGIADELADGIARLVVPVDGADLQVTASIGIAGLDEASTGADDVLAAADAAMYAAKREGRKASDPHRSARNPRFSKPHPRDTHRANDLDRERGSGEPSEV